MLPKVGSFLNNATGTFDQITKVAKGIMCIPSLLGTLFSGGSLKSFGAAVLGAAANIVSNIVQNEIALIGNLVTQALLQLYGDLMSIIRTFRAIFDTVAALRQKAQDTLDYLRNTENCAYAASDLISCVLTSATNIQKTIKKPAQQLNNFNNKLYDAVGGPSGTLNNYVNKNLKFLDKAKMQMNLQNLL
jgi:hypothetical protein